MNLNSLHIVTGAAGVGKSTFGMRLASKHSAAFLDSDTLSEPVVRAGLVAAGMSPIDRDSADYKRIFRDAVYECLFETAAENLASVSVVMVGPFTRELSDPGWPRRLRERFLVKPVIWHLHCDEALRHQRIQKRGNPRDRLKLKDWGQHVQEAPAAVPAFDVKSIDTGLSRGESN